MWIWLGIVACSGGGDGDNPDQVEPTDDVGTPTGETGTPSDLVFTTPVAFAPNTEGAELVGWLTLGTSQETTLEIAIDDGLMIRTQTVDVAVTDHEVMVLGLAPGREHTLTVTATGPDGVLVSDPVLHTTDPLPALFPSYEVVVHDPTRLEAGLTLVRLGPYIVMFDVDGVVRWYIPNEDVVHTVGITSRGTLMTQIGKLGISEMTLSGAPVETWRADLSTDQPPGSVAVPVESIHHDAFEMPNGNWLTLGVERRLIADYPTSETDEAAPRADAMVAGDLVLEFTRDGTLVNEWSLLDRLDPTRIAYDAVKGDYWEQFFGNQDTKDWSHGNSIWYDDGRDEVVVSLRQQDAVVGLDHATGDVKWIFAPDANWTAPWSDLLLRPADPELMVVYHQHSASITPTGNLMLFDNGNNRASAYEPGIPNYTNGSRGAEFALDFDAMTWDLVWEFGTALDPLIFSGSLGDCDPLPLTGNRLVTFGNVANIGFPTVIIGEVTDDAVPEILWELRVDPTLTTFRSERITGVIPGF